MIYLIRHADAVSDEVNPARPLSAKGREQVARVCAMLHGRPGFRPREFWHSPLVRSRETAELLAQGLGLSAPLVLTAGIAPDDDPEAIAAILATAAGDIAVVGHEPHLGVLSSIMVHGRDRAPMFFHFPKAGVLALSPEGKRWRPEWLVRRP
ncbi:MAG TPA: histidine phosphatase family protein [Opitutaceae bacterium]|nr:histidine phosphatase family protein [Opitutaceae bacterium]